MGFMSQQVTDDQINWSRASASSRISSGDLDSSGPSLQNSDHSDTRTSSKGCYHLIADHLNLWLALLNCVCLFFFLLRNCIKVLFAELLQLPWQMIKTLFYNWHKNVSQLLKEYWLFPTYNLGAVVQKITMEGPWGFDMVIWRLAF